MYNQRLLYPKAILLAGELKASDLFKSPAALDASLLLDWIVDKKLRRGNKKGNKASTIRSEAKRIVYLLEFFPSKEFGDLTLEGFVYFLSQYSTSNSVKNNLHVVKSFHDFTALKANVQIATIDWKSPLLRFQNHFRQQQLLTDTEFNRMLVNPAASSLLTVQQTQIILLLMRRAGLRCSEIANLKIGNFAGRTESYFIVKISKSDAGKRILPLHLLLSDTELELLRSYLESLKADKTMNRQFLKQFLFAAADGSRLLGEQIGGAIKKILDANGFSDLTAHGLRHSFACALLCALWLKETLARDLASSDEHVNRWARQSIEQFGRREIEGRALTHADDIRRLMGHSTIEVTFEQYIHVFDLITADAVRLSESAGARKFISGGGAAYLVGGVTERAVRMRFNQNDRAETASKRLKIDPNDVEDWLRQKLKRHLKNPKPRPGICGKREIN